MLPSHSLHNELQSTLLHPIEISLRGCTVLWILLKKQLFGEVLKVFGRAAGPGSEIRAEVVVRNVGGLQEGVAVSIVQTATLERREQKNQHNGCPLLSMSNIKKLQNTSGVSTNDCHRAQQELDSKETEYFRHRFSLQAQKCKANLRRVEELLQDKQKLLTTNQLFITQVGRLHQTNLAKLQYIVVKDCTNKDYKESLKKNQAAFRRIQRDYKALIQHCKTLELELKVCQNQVSKAYDMQRQLLNLGHSDVKMLSLQIKSLTKENCNLNQLKNKLGQDLEQAVDYSKRLKKKQSEAKSTSEQLRDRMSKAAAELLNSKQYFQKQQIRLEKELEQASLRNNFLEEQVRLLLRQFIKNDGQRAELQTRLIQMQETFEKFRKSGELPQLRLKTRKRNKSCFSKSFI